MIVGIHHLGLTVSGVAFSPIAASHSIPGAAVLVFRDPDHIQLELFTDPTRPRGEARRIGVTCRAGQRLPHYPTIVWA